MYNVYGTIYWALCPHCREIPIALIHRKPHIILDSNEKVSTNCLCNYYDVLYNYSLQISAITWHPQGIGPLQVPEVQEFPDSKLLSVHNIALQLLYIILYRKMWSDTMKPTCVWEI